MNKKSLLFGTVSKADLNRIAEKNFSSNICSYKLLDGGLFNTTYLVQIENSERYIFRFGPLRTDVLLPMELNLFEAELQVCQLLRHHKIPSNTPVAIDLTREIIDRDYVIFDYINGTVLSDQSIHPKNRAELYRQTGAITKKMHEIPGDYYGRISDSFRGIRFDSWIDYLFSELQELRNACVKHQVFSAKFFDKAEALFKRGKPYFESVTAPYLVHGDLWAGNIMVSENHEKIAAIIDTDRCLFGDADIDLASPWMITDDFLKGYGQISNSDNPDRKIKLSFYRLLYAITDAYVWKVEYRNLLKYKSSSWKAKKLSRKIDRAISKSTSKSKTNQK